MNIDVIEKPNSMPEDKALISIICPVYNEESCIVLFFERLNKAIRDYKEKYDFELIFTNNCSTDNTLELILDIRKREPWVQVITFSRNFGYQPSLTSGLTYAAGKAIIVIDVDCEDPPELVPELLEKWARGYDVVFGQRSPHHSESALIRFARRAFYRITRIIADHEFVLDMAEFALIGSNVRDVILKNQSTFPFIRADIGFAGFNRVGISYERQRRVAGTSHYKLLSMTKFAIGGILSSSTFPLRVLVYGGIILTFLNMLGIGALFFGATKWDWVPLMLGNLTFLVTSAAVFSIYIARIYKNGLNRPLYVVDQRFSHANRPIQK